MKIKELLDFTCLMMKKLDKKEIDVEEAKAQANLIKQANNIMRYELDVKKFEYKVQAELIKPNE